MKLEYRALVGKLLDLPVTEEQAFRTALWINRNCEGTKVVQGYVIAEGLKGWLPLPWDKLTFIHLEGQMSGMYLAYEREAYSEANEKDGHYDLSLITLDEYCDPKTFSAALTKALSTKFKEVFSTSFDMGNPDGDQQLVSVWQNGLNWNVDPKRQFSNEDRDHICHYIGGLCGMFHSCMAKMSHKELVEQLERNYGYPLHEMGGKIEDNVFKYQGDPDLEPLALATVGAHTFIAYQYSMTSIITEGEDGKRVVSTFRVN